MDKTSNVREWLKDISTNTVGGVLATLVLAVGAGAISKIEPLRRWLFGYVYLFGWSFILIVVAALGAGLLLGLWLKKGPVEEGLPDIFASSAVPRDQPPFQPDDLQKRIIQVLRAMDGEWLPSSEIARVLRPASVQEFRFSLQQLLMKNWVEGHVGNRIKQEGADEYRLAEAGVSFAKFHGMKTRTELESKAN